MAKNPKTFEGVNEPPMAGDPAGDPAHDPGYVSFAEISKRVDRRPVGRQSDGDASEMSDYTVLTECAIIDGVLYDKREGRGYGSVRLSANRAAHLQSCGIQLVMEK